MVTQQLHTKIWYRKRNWYKQTITRTYDRYSSIRVLAHVHIVWRTFLFPQEQIIQHDLWESRK